MNMPIFIELLTRNGTVLQRQRFERTPVRIGRAYDNDLILDDPHVAPHHAVLEDHQGQPLLRCVDTRNGIVLNNRSEDPVPMHGDTLVRLGHTRLRVRRADYPVAEELQDNTNHGWEGLLPAVFGLAIAFAVGLGSEWLGGNSASTTLNLISGALLILLLVVSWAALWGLVNRLFAGYARFGRHLFIASLGLLLDTLWSQLSGVLAYRLSWAALDRYSDLYLLAPMAVAVYFHLITISPRLPQRMATISAAAYLSATGLLLTSTFSDTGSLANKPYMGAPYPPGLRPEQLTSAETFLQGSSVSRERLERLREETEQ